MSEPRYERTVGVAAATVTLGFFAAIIAALAGLPLNAAFAVAGLAFGSFGSLAAWDWLLEGTCRRDEVNERAAEWFLETDFDQFDAAADTIQSLDRELGNEEVVHFAKDVHRRVWDCDLDGHILTIGHGDCRYCGFAPTEIDDVCEI